VPPPVDPLDLGVEVHCLDRAPPHRPRREQRDQQPVPQHHLTTPGAGQGERLAHQVEAPPVELERVVHREAPPRHVEPLPDIGPARVKEPAEVDPRRDQLQRRLEFLQAVPDRMAGIAHVQQRIDVRRDRFLGDAVLGHGGQIEVAAKQPEAEPPPIPFQILLQGDGLEVGDGAAARDAARTLRCHGAMPAPPVRLGPCSHRQAAAAGIDGAAHGALSRGVLRLRGLRSLPQAAAAMARVAVFSLRTMPSKRTAAASVSNST
jgi:hypothetical protein